jgi:hypothetical protein
MCMGVCYDLGFGVEARWVVVPPPVPRCVGGSASARVAAQHAPNSDASRCAKRRQAGGG